MDEEREARPTDPDVEAHKRSFGEAEEPESDTPDVEGHKRSFGASGEPEADDEGHIQTR